MVYVPPGVYPLRGFAYLCTHPGLGRKVAMFLFALFSVSVVAILILAVTTFKHQLSFVGHSFLGSGVVGKLVTCLSILVEASIPVYIAFHQTMKAIQKRLFLDVLHDQGVFAVRPLNDAEQAGLQQYMQTHAAKEAHEGEKGSSLKGFIMRIAQTSAIFATTSPLAAFAPLLPLILTIPSGDKATIPFMKQYLRMRGLTSYAEQMAVADSHRLAYTQFGIAVGMLTAVPIASWGFVFSNTVGAALWAADLEKQNALLFQGPIVVEETQ